MTLCDRLVIANSSFSWWGSRLGRASSRLVVAPDRWYADPRNDNAGIGLVGWTRIPAGAAS
jgi:hypothetical protein